MAMGTFPCGGHVLSLDTIGRDNMILSQEQVSKLDSEYHGDKDEFWFDMARDQETVSFPVGGKVCQGNLFVYSDEDGDRYDELEGGIYLEIDESKIFEKTKTELGLALESAGMFPEFKMWTQFG